jgi:4-amino-4-deoxy-L-arabinose transferase-like glycosyltransferase
MPGNARGFRLFTLLSEETEKILSEKILPPTTAGISPEKFSDDLFFSRNRNVIIFFLLIFLSTGFVLRAGNLGAESLSEDELNKLQTVAEYRENGLSGRNGEHPFLMKGLQTVSISIADRLNNSFFSANPISEETALRFPTALFGTFTALLLFFLLSELFDKSIGLIAAALWAVDPNAVGFDRIAKEDSFLLFFFVLASIFWLKAQTRVETERVNWLWFTWASAAAFGAMMASKYLPHLIAVTAAYNKIFQLVPGIRWKFDRYDWLKFFIVMGVAFLIFNPTILFPETWREMLTFGTEKRIGHDSYEFMGELYRNKMTAWLAGVPWTFYYVFIFVKTPVVTLIFFLIGLPLIFQKKLGDGRYFIFFWALMWFMPFTVLGGKFMRYFTVAQPLVFIIAAIGFYFMGLWLSDKISQFSRNNVMPAALQTLLFLILIIPSLLASFSVSPYFRLHTNTIGGGMANAGFYFPHDEFYDTSTREIAAKIIERARPGAVIANETPGLFEHYLRKAGRKDLISVSLSDKEKVRLLTEGDFIVAARGRRYVSNTNYLNYLENSAQPFAEINAREVSSAKIYQLDQTAVAQIQAIAQ